MTIIKQYKIPTEILINSGNRNWVITHSEFIKHLGFDIYIFDHVDSNTEILFQTELSQRLCGIKIDGIGINTSKFMDEIKTDQLVYVTENEVTKNNIGTTYQNVFTDFNGRPFFIDTTGFTGMAIQILWTKNGTGTQRLRIVNNADNTEVLESTSLTTQSNDFPSVTIPQTFLNFRGKWRLECKSTIDTDSPIFNGVRIYLRR